MVHSDRIYIYIDQASVEGISQQHSHGRPPGGPYVRQNSAVHPNRFCIAVLLAHVLGTLTGRCERLRNSHRWLGLDRNREKADLVRANAKGTRELSEPAQLCQFGEVPGSSGTSSCRICVLRFGRESFLAHTIIRVRVQSWNLRCRDLVEVESFVRGLAIGPRGPDFGRILTSRRVMLIGGIGRSSPL